jgi:hypothetical protein
MKSKLRAKLRNSVRSRESEQLSKGTGTVKNWETKVSTSGRKTMLAPIFQVQRATSKTKASLL